MSQHFQLIPATPALFIRCFQLCLLSVISVASSLRVVALLSVSHADGFTRALLSVEPASRVARQPTAPSAPVLLLPVAERSSLAGIPIGCVLYACMAASLPAFRAALHMMQCCPHRAPRALRLGSLIIVPDGRITSWVVLHRSDGPLASTVRRADRLGGTIVMVLQPSALTRVVSRLCCCPRRLYASCLRVAPQSMIDAFRLQLCATTPAAPHALRDIGVAHMGLARRTRVVWDRSLLLPPPSHL